jgi:hypothetical protein
MKKNFVSKQRNSLHRIKTLIFIIVFLTIHSGNLFSQRNLDKTVSKDSLTWHIYIGGKPDKGRLKAVEVVARDWSMKTDVFFGDCVGTYDYKAKEFEKKNKSVYEFLVQNMVRTGKINLTKK